LPFRIAARSLVHRVRLHGEGVGSGNPLGVDGNMFRIPFYPYFYVKDRRGFLLLMLVYSIYVFFAPNVLGHTDNYIPANPIVTPAHIVPE